MMVVLETRSGGEGGSGSDKSVGDLLMRVLE